MNGNEFGESVVLERVDEHTGWQGEPLSSGTLGTQAPDADHVVEDALLGRGNLGSDLVPIEQDEHITGFDMIAILHADQLDDATGVVLHRFARSFDDDSSRCDHGTFDRRHV